MACTGIEFCKLAIVETKAAAATAIAELEQRLADVTAQIDAPVTLNVNGRPNSCCLLYPSDAADERSRVELGGRRIIKKKKKKKKTHDEE